MSVRIEYRIEGMSKALEAFGTLDALGRDPSGLLADIATYGEASTRERFATQTGPDGEQWEPSFRAKFLGGKTLTRDGHLRDSISSFSNASQAVWGANRIYAAIHQFGGEIVAREAGALRFELVPGSGIWVTTAAVQIPARPYLGLSAEDKDEIEALGAAHIKEALQ